MLISPAMGGSFQGKRVFFVVLLVLGTAILAAGCGDDDSDAAAVAVKTGSLSKAEFVKQAGKVCEAGRARHTAKGVALLEENPKLKQGTMSKEGAVEFIDLVIRPVYLQEAKEIAELGVPESEADEVAEIVAALEADMDELKANPQNLLRSRPSLPTADAKAEEYGLTLCAAIWI